MLRAYVASNCEDFYAQTVEQRLNTPGLKLPDDLKKLVSQDDQAPLAKPTKAIPEPSAEGLEVYAAQYRSLSKDDVSGMQSLCKSMRSRYRVVLGLIASSPTLSADWLHKATPVGSNAPGLTHFMK